MRNKLKIDKQLRIPEDQYFLWGVFLSFIICVFFIVSYKITFDDDFFWHLSVGRFIVENKYVPDKDVFGFVTSGIDWIPFEWGWDVLSYSLYNIGGYNAILVLRSLIFCLIFLLYFHILKRLKVNSVISLILLFTLMFAMMDRFSPRPHIMSYLFIVLLLYIYLPFKYIDREKNIKKLYFLPLLFLFWGNMHMGVIAGGLLLFVLVISEIFIYCFPSKLSSPDIKPLSNEHLIKFSIISVLCALMLLVNPHTYNTYLYTYSHLQMNMMNSIAEWQNPFTGKVDNNFILILYKIFLYSGIIILIYAFIKKDFTAALVCIAFAIHSVRALRFTVDYEVTVIPFLIISINYFSNIAGYKWKIYNRVLNGNEFKVLLILLFANTAFYAQNSKLYDFLNYYRVSGWGINENYVPVKVFDFIKKSNITGNPFNQYEVGGSLIWNLPEQKNFIDSRALSDEIFDEYNSIFYKYPGFEMKLKKHGFDYAIYYNPELINDPNLLTKNIVSYFAQNSEWKLVFWDDKSMLFVKDIPKFANVIENYEYKVIKPFSALFNKAEFESNVRANPQTVKDELKRKSETEPKGYLFQTLNYTVYKLLQGL